MLIQAWTKPRVAENSQQRRNRRESTQGPSNPPRPNLARRRILPCRLSIAYTPNRGGQLSAAQGFGNRAWGANQTFEELGLSRLASMSFRRRPAWIAWLLPEPKVLELPGNSAFNRNVSFARWQPYYTDRELELDRRIHAFALLLALIATPLLLGLAAESRRPGLVLPFAIYLLSLLGMLGSSTLFRHTPLRWSNYRWFLRRLG